LRDFDLFLDPNNARTGHAFLQPATVLTATVLRQKFCDKDATVHEDSKWKEGHYHLLELLDFTFLFLAGWQ
jgi:hypothetical protein